MRHRDWVSVVCGVAAALTAVLAIGGAFRWTQALVGVLVAVAVLAQLPSRRALGRLSPLLVSLGLAAGLTGLSVLPLPSALRNVLDPTGTGLREDGAALLDVSPWPALSRDVPGSLRALVFFLILLGIAGVALRAATSERGRYRLHVGVGLLCVLTGVIVGVHELLGASRLYGIYELQQAKPRVLGPLVNENHLGCLMALGTCVAIGLAMYPRQRSWKRAAWIGAVIICGATAAASGSRGALIALAASAMITGAIIAGQKFSTPESTTRGRRASFATSSLPIGIVAVCAVVVVIYTSAGKVTRELGRTSVDDLARPKSKFAAWRSTEHLIVETPWVGVGRGGFEPSFTRVHPASGTVTFSHVENEYIQAVVDWGVPGAALLAGAIVWFAAAALRRWRDSTLAAGAIGGLSVVAFQSSVDFGVELLGIAVPVTIIATTLGYVPFREGPSRAVTISRLWRLCQVGALLAGAALLLSSKTNSIAEDHASLASSRVDLDEVRTVIQRHPLDYYSYAIAAQEMIRTGDKRAVPVLNHAMLLHPTLPELHRMAARLLLRTSHRDQAAIEYAVALRSTSEPLELLTEIVGVFSAVQAAAAVPTDHENPDLILKHLRDLHRDDVATLWLSRVVEAHPRDVKACNQLYELSLSSGNLKAAEVAGRSCVELLPDHQTRLSLANVLYDEGAYVETIRLLQDVATWRGLVEDQVRAWLILCDAHDRLDHWDDAVLCLHRLEASGAVTIGQREPITKRLAAIAARRRQRDVAPEENHP